LSIFEHILENIHRICLLRPIPNRQNRPSIRPSCPSTTSLPPNTSDKTTLKRRLDFYVFTNGKVKYHLLYVSLFLRIHPCHGRTLIINDLRHSNLAQLKTTPYPLIPKIPSVFLTNFCSFCPTWKNPFIYQKKYENLKR
jgi:hypothetical protein